MLKALSEISSSSGIGAIKISEISSDTPSVVALGIRMGLSLEFATIINTAP
jgi:hypothetical protein